MEGALPIFFLLVVLKIPVFFGIYLVYWAAKSYDEFGEELSGGDEDHGFRRWRREPRRPRGPRRGGDHGDGTAAEPAPRTRGPMPVVRPRASGVGARERR